MTDDMVVYYARRAAEYDSVYEMPQWQRDVEIVRQTINDLGG